jgi:hypothetical protein
MWSCKLPQFGGKLFLEALIFAKHEGVAHWILCLIITSTPIPSGGKQY